MCHYYLFFLYFQDADTRINLQYTGSRIVAGTAPNGQLWLSMEGGETWALKKDLLSITPEQSHVAIFHSEYVPYNKRILAGTMSNAQIWASDDGGENWTLKKDFYQESTPQTHVVTLTVQPHVVPASTATIDGPSKD
jgi:hypothetical protein